MATPGNYRNGVGTQFPNLFTSPDDTYQVGVLIKLNWHLLLCKRNLLTGQITDLQDLEFNSVALTDGITPILSDALGGDSHYGAAGMLDSLHRIHLCGNSLSTTPHYIRSSPANGTWPLTWTSIAWPWPGIPQSGGHSLTGDDTTTYHNFERLSNGDVLHYISQREATGAPEGADMLLFRIPAGSNNHVPLIGNGEFATSEATAPDRVYIAMVVVEQYPHKDRVWVLGNWRMDWTQVSTSCLPWLVYNDTVTNASTWKDINGNPVTMPITWTSSGGAASTNPNPTVGATVPLLHGPGYFYGSFQLWIDSSGYPHFVHQEQFGTVKWWHVWWNGTTWTDEAITTSSNTPSVIIQRNGAKLFWREFNGRIQFDSVPAGTSFKCGNPVPGTWDITAYDPIQAAKGYLHLLLPDGDTPEICEIGNNTSRAKAS